METDNAAIAKVTKKGRIVAVSIGDTVVTAYAVSKSGKKTEIGTIKVQVKANAKTVSIDGIPENNTFGIGDYTLTAVQTNARGGAANDAVQFSIPEEYKEIAEITADGKLTTKKTGDFKIAVKTYQNSKLTGATAKAEVEVKAAVNLVAATQKSNSSFALSFDSRVKDIVSASDFEVFYKANTADVKLTVNTLTVDSSDPTKAVLSIWQTLNAGTEYFVSFKGGAPVAVKAASLNPEDAAKVNVSTTSAVVNILTDIKYSVVDANGIEIPNVENNVTFSTEDSAVASIAGNQIVFFEKGKTATVKVVYSAWYVNSDNQYVEKTFTDYVKITSKEADAVTIAATKWTVGANSTSVFDSSNFVQNTFVAVNDETNNYLNLYLKLSDGNVITSDDGVSNLTYASADSNILVMDGNIIRPVKEGTTQILVYKDGASTPIVVIPMTVKPKRVPATLTATLSKTTLNTVEDTNPTSGAGFTDKIKVTVNVRDNYGKPFDGAQIKYERVSGITLDTNANAVAGGWSNGSASFEITAGQEIAFNAAGSLAFKVSASANGVSTNPVVLSLSARSVSGSATTQKLVLGNSSIDTKLTADSLLSSFGITVQTADFKDGYQIANPQPVQLDVSKNYVNDGEARYYYKLYKGAAEVTNLTGDKDSAFVEDGKINAISVNDDSKLATKLAAGTYTVRLYKVVVNTSGNVTSKTLVDSISLTITDSQPGMTITKLKNNIDTLTAQGLLDAQAFRVVYNSSPEVVLLSDTVSADANLKFITVDGTSSIYVKEAVYTITFDGSYKFEIRTPVGTTLTR